MELIHVQHLFTTDRTPSTLQDYCVAIARRIARSPSSLIGK
jgi:hypothetical protein